MSLDWSLARGFRLRVLEQMFRIPYGQTVSYGELAARAGNPRAPRAAGQACATNPIPIVLPCHRVVRSNGDLNWYTGGLHYKEFLLRLEGALGPVVGADSKTIPSARAVEPAEFLRSRARSESPGRARATSRSA